MIITGSLRDFQEYEIDYIVENLQDILIYTDDREIFEFLRRQKMLCDLVTLKPTGFETNLGEVIRTARCIVPSRGRFDNRLKRFRGRYKFIYIRGD